MIETDILFKKVKQLEKELEETKFALRNSKDGFYYKVTFYYYRTKREKEFNNSYCLEEFINDSRDGDNYIIAKVETDNPKWKDWKSGYEEYNEENTEGDTQQKEYYAPNASRPRRFSRPEL